jgi:predicted DNA-binding transcriptional regulator
MAIALDAKQIVSSNELLMFQVVSRKDVIRLLVEKGIFSKEEIIKQDYGYVYTKYPLKYMEEFREYEREAKEKRRGLWK